MYLEFKLFSRYCKQRYSNRLSFDNHARTWKSFHETFYFLSRDKRQFRMLRLAFVTCKLTAGWVWNFHPNVAVECGFDIRLPSASTLWLNFLYASCEPLLRSIHWTTHRTTELFPRAVEIKTRDLASESRCISFLFAFYKLFTLLKIYGTICCNLKRRKIIFISMCIIYEWIQMYIAILYGSWISGFFPLL